LGGWVVGAEISSGIESVIESVPVAGGGSAFFALIRNDD
jgi:hypothetical protein